MAGVSEREIERALDAPGEVRCFLLFGADEAGSRALAARLPGALGADAERVDLTPAQLKADPALLADEAASVSLFGTRRFIRVDGAGEDCASAVEALLAATATDNPVLLIGTATMKRDSRLVTLITQHPFGRAYESKTPTPESAAATAESLARGLGLRLAGGVTGRLLAATGGDRALTVRELEKLALFLDAATDRVREVDDAALDAIGVDAGEADLGRVFDAVLAGDEVRLDGELARAAADGAEGITVIRAGLRRFGPLAAARAELDRGTAAGAAIGRHVFGRDREVAARCLPRWSAARLAAAICRLGEMERALKRPDTPGPVAVSQLLMGLTRAARNR